MRETLTGLWRWVRHWLLGSDVGVVYAVMLLVMTLYLTFAPDHVRDSIVAYSSTNLRNLRVHPLSVLWLSGFIVPSLGGLWSSVPFLLLAFTIVQRTLGRAALIISAVFGHIGATLFVSVLLRSGISKGLVDPSVRLASDVGFSYAMFGVAGMVVVWFTRTWTKLAYVAVLSLYLGAYAVFSRTFTDIGHVSAWLIGLATACVAGTALRRGRREGAAPYATDMAGTADAAGTAGAEERPYPAS